MKRAIHYVDFCVVNEAPNPSVLSILMAMFVVLDAVFAQMIRNQEAPPA